MRPLIAGIAGACLLLATGCQTPHTFARPDASWSSHIGQLKHTNSERALVGEVVVQRRGAQEFQLDFVKGGSFPLLSLRQYAEAARAEGLLAGGRWQGTPDKAPAALRPWLRLREFFSGIDPVPAGAVPSEPLTFRDDGQRFEFLFSR